MLLALIFSVASLVSQQRGAPARTKVGIENEIDRAISHLPRVECEGGWDSMGGYSLRLGARDLRGALSIGARMTDEQWTRALETAGVLRTRARWPAGVPVAFSMNAPAWLHPVQMYAVPRDLKLMSLQAGDLAHLHCGLRIEKECAEKQRKAEYQEIGTPEVGKHHIVFDVTVEEGSYENGTSFGGTFVPNPRPKQPAGTVLWRGPIAIDVEVVPTLEDAMPANDSSDLSDIVRRWLFRAPSSFERGTGVDGDVGVCLDIGPRDARNAAFSLECALYRGDVCLARGWTLAKKSLDYGTCTGTVFGRWTDVVELGRVHVALLTAKPPPEELELRVRGVPKDVLRDFDAKEWWIGTVSVPLSSLAVLN
jgi:hypothetical protein